MKKTKRVFSILLAMLMLITAIPFAVSAENKYNCATDGHKIIRTGKIIEPVNCLDRRKFITIKKCEICNTEFEIIETEESEWIHGDHVDIDKDNFCDLCGTDLIYTCGLDTTWSFDESTKTLTITGTGNIEKSYYSDFWDDYIIQNTEKLVIEEGVNTIYSIYAFAGFENLESAVLPESLTYLAAGTFAGCKKLTSVSLGHSMEYISYLVFRDSGIFNDKSNWENGALYIDEYLVELDDREFNDFTVKDGTKLLATCWSLKNGASKDVENISLPNTIEYLGDFFLDKTDKLTEIYYDGTESEFSEKVDIGRTNLSSDNIRVHYNSNFENHWKEESTATCTQPGFINYTCACGFNKTGTTMVPPIDHKPIVINAKPATETEKGYTGDTVCSFCGKVFKSGTTIPVSSTMNPEDYPDLESGEYVHRNSGNNFEFFYENECFVNGTQFKVEEVSAGTDFDSLSNKKHNKFKMYDLSAQCGEINVQPNGDIWVALHIPGNFNPENTVVYYVNGDEIVSMPCFVQDGKIYFKTNHFSSYAVVDLTEEQKTEDNCICHKAMYGKIYKVLYKIVRVYWKLFGINKTCSCGAKHY